VVARAVKSILRLNGENGFASAPLYVSQRAGARGRLMRERKRGILLAVAAPEPAAEAPSKGP